ncbi:MAG: hypothetical protein OEY89_09290, partial [Gammaproteobacteria bacterium]|nr:hypothetical protein [Gammaproteobacteria bacterium]
MSDGIQLSDEFVNNLYELIVTHDPRAENDMTLGLQYLAVVTGYWSAAYPGTDDERQELLNQLAAFSRHVSDEQAAAHQQTPEQPALTENIPKGKSITTDDPAMGVW